MGAPEARKTERRVVQMRNARERTARMKAAQEGVSTEAAGEGEGEGEDGAEGHSAHVGEKRKATAAESDSVKKARTNTEPKDTEYEGMFCV